MSHNDKGSTGKLHQKLHGKHGKAAHDESENPIQDENVDVELLAHPTYVEMQKKLTEAEGKAAQHWDRLLRMQADMDNMQRRVERDVANAHKFALEKFVQELLPVVDNMERSLQMPENGDPANNAIHEGVALTLKMFVSVLEKFGVVQIDPVGETFNPELHQAVSVQPDPKVKPNTVLMVLQKGYLLNNRLVRPALVIVSSAG